MRLPEEVLVVGNAILLPPFRRDLLTYDRDVNEALGIFCFKKNPFYFVRLTLETIRHNKHTTLQITHTKNN